MREKELGSDPLDVDADSFLERFEGRKGGVRAALMNQQVLAGIGNTYSEEILFQVRLHPKTSVAHPDAPILGKLHTEVWRLLKVTIEWEATRTNYRNPSCSLTGARARGAREAMARSGRSKPQDKPPTTALHAYLKRGD